MSVISTHIHVKAQT